MKPIRVWQGMRRVAINMAQNNFPIPQGECIFVDCNNCDQSIKLYYETTRDNMQTSDEEAAKIMRSYGWVLRRGMYNHCPDCRKSKPRKPILTPIKDAP